MNVLPCRIDGTQLVFDSQTLPVHIEPDKLSGEAKLEIGIRPEFIAFSGVQTVVAVDTH